MKSTMEQEGRGKQGHLGAVIHHVRRGCVGAVLLLALSELWVSFMPPTDLRESVYGYLTYPGMFVAAMLDVFSGNEVAPIVLGVTYFAVNFLFYSAALTLASALWRRRT